MLPLKPPKLIFKGSSVALSLSANIFFLKGVRTRPGSSGLVRARPGSSGLVQVHLLTWLEIRSVKKSENLASLKKGGKKEIEKDEK